MKVESTHPIEVNGIQDAAHLWQRNEITVSFDLTRQVIVGWPDKKAADYKQPLSNHSESSTIGPQEITPPTTPVSIIEGARFGKRSFIALFEWEGVVECVEDDKFQCKILPLTPHSIDPSAVQLTEFSFDDLSTESDLSLVVPGAIFYWTVGRSRNAAGTLTNLSLLRFRRLPIPTNAQVSNAEQEAEDILRILTDDDGFDSTGS